MYVSLEKLAQEVVASGKLRIDAGSKLRTDHNGNLRLDTTEKVNFIRYPTDSSVIFLSHRELYDKNLVQNTINRIGKTAVDTLREEISTNQLVELDIEEKIARLIVQSTHPAVVKLALLEGVEIFVSYSQNISDLLDLQNFEKHGSNSGMQSIGSAESRVFVSCGSDPFSDVKEYKDKAVYALARFLVIAGQEFGHFADLMRDSNGNAYSRHSASFNGYRAKKKVREARLKDLAMVKKTIRDLNKVGLVKTAKTNKSIEFYAKHRKRSFRHILTIIQSYLQTRKFRRKAIQKNINFVALHSAKDIKIMLPDMKFNLHPKASVYENENPTIEEAIICVEALARVPQQVNKWGHKTTQYLYPNLYAIYYEEVIPAVIKSVENITREKFHMEYKKPRRGLFG